MTEDSVMMGRVFVSYVHADSSHVDDLCGLLNSVGFPVWRDTASLWPGEDWKAKIRSAIRGDALVFLACFSRRGTSRVKSYQNEELVTAVEEMRLRPPGQPWLIPVRFDDCQLPECGIGGGRTLADLQQADLFGECYKQNADRLVLAVRRIFGRALSSGTTATGTTCDGLTGGTATPGEAGGWPARPTKYAVRLDGAKSVQIGDGNIQNNTFSG